MNEQTGALTGLVGSITSGCLNQRVALHPDVLLPTEKTTPALPGGS